jgi:ArsR family transcriptional regulator
MNIIILSSEVHMIDISNKEKTKKILEEKAEMLKTIAHPVRLCILTLLIKEEKSNVSDIQCCIDVPQPTVSQHLAKLKSANILSSERNGTEIIYKIKNKEVKQIIEFILQ